MTVPMPMAVTMAVIMLVVIMARMVMIVVMVVVVRMALHAMVMTCCVMVVLIRLHIMRVHCWCVGKGGTVGVGVVRLSRRGRRGGLGHGHASGLVNRKRGQAGCVFLYPALWVQPQGGACGP